MEGKFTVNLAVYNPDDAAAQLEPEKAFEYLRSAMFLRVYG